MANKDNLYLNIPDLNPDKIVKTFSGTFAISGAAYSEGSSSIANSYGLGFPISEFTNGNGTKYNDNAQPTALSTPPFNVTTVVTATDVTYYWVNISGGSQTITYNTVLLSLS
jgi:hypothetical protein